jgi:hypothetical protein
MMAAMMTASTEVVSLVLSCGANIQSVDVMGNDSFMYAATYGRPKNLQCWLERVKDWDLNRKNTVVGGCALGCAVYMGANKVETVKVLLDAGVSTALLNNVPPVKVRKSIETPASNNTFTVSTLFAPMYTAHPRAQPPTTVFLRFRSQSLTLSSQHCKFFGLPYVAAYINESLPITSTL